jgi:hypothetical protein
MVSPDPTNASNLSSGDVPLAQLGNAPSTDTTTLEDDVALLGFKVAANGSFGKYNLVDQTIDAYEDTTGVNAGDSTNAGRNINNYYSGGIVTSPTGGTETTYESEGTTYSVNTFLTSDDFVVASTVSVDAIIVGGGGQGGALTGGTGVYGFGGGGGGAVLHRTGYSVTAATYAIVIGDGGDATSGNPESGSDSTGFSVSATGGGGGNTTAEGSNGQAGANGGGAGYSNSGGTGTAPTASGWTVYAGNNGSAGYNGLAHGGGGGGGAAAVGTAGTATNGGAGGAGKQIAIGNTNYYWGAGGAGSVAYTGTAGVAGIGGSGGAGGDSGPSVASAGDSGNSINPGTTGIVSTSANGGDAGANTGSGGGGKYGDGGTGIVIIQSVQSVTANNMILTSATTAAETAPTKGDIVMTYTNQGAAASLNVDLTAEISADGGSTWTVLTLASEGSTGAHKIVTAHNVTIGTVTAPYNMAYRIKTFDQSASKETRIQAVSLGWS